MKVRQKVRTKKLYVKRKIGEEKKEELIKRCSQEKRKKDE